MWNSTFFVIIAALVSSASAFNNNSVRSSSLVCPTTRFGCQNAYRCLKLKLMCDGRNDCGDNSDEQLSSCIERGVAPAQLTCASSEFQCKNGFQCVPATHLCDNDNDCKDNSDEDPNECIRAGVYDENVTCPDIGFVCGEGAGPCINLKFLCNGKNDCGDNSDENFTICGAEGVITGELSCADHEFRCKNGFKCVSKLYLCDHYNDCFDGSDEDPVACAKEGLIPEGTTCTDLGFECVSTTFNGSFCIGNLFICDGKDDCLDNSDENPDVCEQRSEKPTIEILPWYEPPVMNSTVVRHCGNDHFVCGSECTSKRFLCNPNLACDKRIDEDTSVCSNRTSSHKCMTHEFKCKNDRCIYIRHACDDDDDCGDNSDEDPKICKHFPNSTATTTANISQPVALRKRPLICKRNQFKCLDDSGCTPKSTVCDRDPDCPDGSDETQETCIKYSINASCANDEIQCNNKRCIDASFICDGDDDCEDKTDELPPYCNGSSTGHMESHNSKVLILNVIMESAEVVENSKHQAPRQISCFEEQFRCSTLSTSFTCIPLVQVCDGTKHCPLGDDENSDLCKNLSTPAMQTTTLRATPLAEVSCAANEFLCTDKRTCISVEKLCDKSQDCDNGSDEDPFICVSPTSQRPVESKIKEKQNRSKDYKHAKANGGIDGSQQHWFVLW